MVTSDILNLSIRIYKKIQFYFKESITYRFLCFIVKKASVLTSESKILCFVARRERTSEIWYESGFFRILQFVFRAPLYLFKLLKNAVYESRVVYFLKGLTPKREKSLTGVNVVATIIFTGVLINLCLSLMMNSYSSIAIIARGLLMIVCFPAMLYRIDFYKAIDSSVILSKFTGVMQWLFTEL